MRTATINRQTNETQIEMKLNLDGDGRYQGQTGVGFLDHMLHLFAAHGLFDLELQVQGDLHIDAHHTVEDVGIVLGQAIDQALGNRQGIVRMAHAYVPMDETLGFVAVDLSGRPCAIIDAAWHGPMLGQMATTLVPHFLESVAFQGRMNLHARVLYGRDDHHQAEALFKAFARALDQATQFDHRRGDQIPSTKGSL